MEYTFEFGSGAKCSVSYDSLILRSRIYDSPLGNDETYTAEGPDAAMAFIERMATHSLTPAMVLAEAFGDTSMIDRLNAFADFLTDVAKQVILDSGRMTQEQLDTLVASAEQTKLQQFQEVMIDLPDTHEPMPLTPRMRANRKRRTHQA